MANILGDNTVIPSYLGTRNRGRSKGSTALLNDFTLHIGEVKKLIYPSDKSSYSGKNLEYEVEIQHREGNGVYTTCLYRGATASNVFGGIADRFHATFREDKRKTGTEDDDVGVGSKVLVICLAGDQQKAIILGGLNDPNDTKDKPKKDDGHNLFFEFNGIKFEINKDGEAKLTFRGATKVDGELTDDADPEAEGTYVEFNKDGNVTIATPEDKQFIRVNHKDKKLEVLVDEEWNTEVNGKMVCTVEKNIDIESKSDKINMTASSNVVIKSAGVLVGDATDNWPLFTTYRTQEATMHQMMQSALGQLSAAGGALTGAGASLTASGPMMAIPVAGAIMAGPGIAAAGAAVTTAAGMITAAATMLTSAIATFEAAKATYESKKNKND